MSFALIWLGLLTCLIWFALGVQTGRWIEKNMRD